MKFLYKFTLFLGTAVAFCCIVQFWVFNKFFVSNTNSLLLNINEGESENINMQLSENFHKIENFLKIVAANDEIKNSQELIDKFNRTTPEMDVVTILDSRGNILRMSGNKYTPIVSNLAYRDYFKKAIIGKIYISDVFTTPRGFKVVAISVPIINGNKIDGVVVGTVKLQGTSLASMFDNKKFGKNGYISILDSKGYTVYYPNKKLIGKKSVIFDKLNGKSGSKIAKDFSGKDQFIGYSKIANLNWIVTVSTPTAEIMKSRSIVNYETLLMSIMLGVLITLLGAYTVRRYTKPLDKLIFSFNSLKNGKYKKIDSSNYTEEYHEIIKVYNNTIARLEEEYSELEEAANIDSLTGALNRRAFDNLLSDVRHEINICSLESLGIILLDVDHFKNLNDTQGHLAGDKVLKRLAEIMKSAAGKKSVFRFGGDEFAVILRNVSDEKLLSIAEEIRLSGEVFLDGCTLSIGVSILPKDTYSVDELLDFADKALYISKESKNKVTMYS